MEKEDLNILRLMREIDRDGNSSQRELSRRLNISLGLVNTFLKRLIKKGYFKVKTMPRNRVRSLRLCLHGSQCCQELSVIPMKWGNRVQLGL